MRAGERQGGDGQPASVTFEAVNGREIGHETARPEICSGIVDRQST